MHKFVLNVVSVWKTLKISFQLYISYIWPSSLDANEKQFRVQAMTEKKPKKDFLRKR